MRTATTLIDSMGFPELARDISYGRYPDANDTGSSSAPPRPGAANQAGYVGLVGEIEFSQKHGFYNEPFSVTLTTDTPDAAIYYTLDGDLPGQMVGRNLSGTLYAGPISISKTTCLRAVAIRQGWKPSAVTRRPTSSSAMW